MSSQGAAKWLKRLEHPRSIDSLISEVYGEAAFYGCLFEREMADTLNFLDLGGNPIAALVQEPFNTEDWTLDKLLKEVKKRGVLEGDHFTLLNDGREARNELIHRLLGAELVVSNADKEMLLARIDALYLRIWKAYRFTNSLKKQLAAKVSFTEEKANAAMRDLQEKARIEDENLRRILHSDEGESKI